MPFPRSTSLVLKFAKFRNHKLRLLSLISANIKTQEEAEMSLCKIKKKKTKQNKGVITREDAGEEASSESSKHRSFVYRLKR